MKIHTQSNSRHIQTIVIGGGQAGLSVGYHLAKRGISFLILDANQRIGDAWRNRWDSLRLFTTARYCGLPGLPFPARGDAFPTKQEMADYLESYAANLNLRVQTGVKVDRLAKEGDRFVVTAGALRFEAENVVVAMANYQIPRRPEFARDLDSGIVQLHSHEYRNPSQLQDGGVLIVGVGNSGADIAMEVARTHPAWISGKESGHIPWPIESFMGRFFLIRLLRFAGHHVLNREHSDRPEAAPQDALSVRSAGAGQTQGPDQCRYRASPQSGGSAERTAPAFGRSHTRCEECDLVHGIPSRFLVD